MKGYVAGGHDMLVVEYNEGKEGKKLSSRKLYMRVCLFVIGMIVVRKWQVRAHGVLFERVK